MHIAKGYLLRALLGPARVIAHHPPPQSARIRHFLNDAIYLGRRSNCWSLTAEWGLERVLVIPVFILSSVIKLHSLLQNSLGIWSIIWGLVFGEDVSCSLGLCLHAGCFWDHRVTGLSSACCGDGADPETTAP